MPEGGLAGVGARAGAANPLLDGLWCISTLVGQYTAQHRSFGGLVVPTWRRVFRRNPDGTVNLNMRSITIDIEDVILQRGSEKIGKH